MHSVPCFQHDSLDGYFQFAENPFKGAIVDWLEVLNNEFSIRPINGSEAEPGIIRCGACIEFRELACFPAFLSSLKLQASLFRLHSYQCSSQNLSVVIAGALKHDVCDAAIDFRVSTVFEVLVQCLFCYSLNTAFTRIKLQVSYNQ